MTIKNKRRGKKLHELDPVHKAVVQETLRSLSNLFRDTLATSGRPRTQPASGFSFTPAATARAAGRDCKH